MFLGVQEVFNGWKSAKWPTVEGKVTTSSVEAQASTDKRSLTYHAKIVYDYAVDGKRFSGDRVAFGALGTDDPSHAQAIVDRYSQGKSVSVFDNPDDQQESLLEPGLKAGAWFFIWLGVPFFLIGVAMVKFFPKLV